MAWQLWARSEIKFPVSRFEAIRCVSQVPLTGWIQIILFCGMVDFGLYRADESRDPGDYEPLGPQQARLQRPRNAGILGVPNASGPMSDVEGRKRTRRPCQRAADVQEVEFRAGQRTFGHGGAFKRLSLSPRLDVKQCEMR